MRYSKHAQEKLALLKAHGVDITEEAVAATLRSPDQVRPRIGQTLIAQRRLNERHVLRVVHLREETR